MKKIILIALVLINIGIGCKKEDKSTGTTTSTASSCQNSIWKYEVILANPVPCGSYQIRYFDNYQNMVVDTTITSTWTKNIGQVLTPQGGGHAVTGWLGVFQGPQIYSIPFGTNITNRVTVNIYKDNVIVATTGGPVDFCVQNSTTPCSVTSVNSIIKTYSCSF